MAQYIRNPHCETILLDEEWIILNSDRYTITKLNPTGGFCWSLLASPHSARSLAEAVEEKYGPLDGAVRTDMEAFLSELLECGLAEHAG